MRAGFRDLWTLPCPYRSATLATMTRSGAPRSLRSAAVALVLVGFASTSVVACGGRSRDAATPGGEASAAIVSRQATTARPDGVALATATRTPAAGGTETRIQPSARPSATVTARPSARSFTVAATGDILLHSGLWAQARRDAGGSGYDFVPLFGQVRPAVAAADLAICHLETPLGPPDGPFSGYPVFSVPPQVAPALATTGYDSCSTASNHSIDKGERGVERTLNALDAAGIAHTGTARSAAEQRRVNLLTVRGVVVAHLSYSYGFNGLVRPRGKEYLANQLRAKDVLAEARRARRAGAEVVIVSVHWGTEYQHQPTSQQTSLAKKLLAGPDVNLLLGHHAHVVQPVRRIGDKWVAYGMGNEVSWQSFAKHTTDGIMPRFTFTEVSPGRFQVTTVEVRALHMWLNRPARVYDVATVLATPDAPVALKEACRASLRRTGRVLGTVDGMVLAGTQR